MKYSNQYFKMCLDIFISHKQDKATNDASSHNYKRVRPSVGYQFFSSEKKSGKHNYISKRESHFFSESTLTGSFEVGNDITSPRQSFPAIE